MEKQGKGSDHKKVMIVIDESEQSHYALIWALDNLKESMANFSLLILAPQPLTKCNSAVGSPLGFGRLFRHVSAITNLVGSIHEENRKVALGILEKAKYICAGRGLKAETVAEEGEPRDVICRAVKKYKIDMIVIGNKQNNSAIGYMKRAFLGSLTDYCSDNAMCPVLVVNKP